MESVNITLLVLTRIGPGLSGSEISGWRVDSCTLTCEYESEVSIPLEPAVTVSIAMMNKKKLNLTSKVFWCAERYLLLTYLRHSQF